MKQRVLFATVILAVVVGVFAAATLSRQHHALGPNRPKQHRLAEKVITVSTDKPSEVKPTSYKWTGAAADPKKLTIPGIGVDAFVQAVGVDQHKQIAVPNNIFLAGWYAKSVVPGQAGLSVIDGHVTGLHNPGVFTRLSDLHTGDTFQVVRGDDVVLTFTVRATQLVDVADAENVLFNQLPNVKSQLDLITCGGSYIPSLHVYNKRLIVLSELTSTKPVSTASPANKYNGDPQALHQQMQAQSKAHGKH